MRTKLGTVTEAALALGVDAAAIWEMVARGELEASREALGMPWMIWQEEA